MKILPVGAELFHAEGWTDRYNEANSRFSQFCEAPTRIHNSRWPVNLTVKWRFLLGAFGPVHISACKEQTAIIMLKIWAPPYKI